MQGCMRHSFNRKENGHSEKIEVPSEELLLGGTSFCLFMRESNLNEELPVREGVIFYICKS